MSRRFSIASVVVGALLLVGTPLYLFLDTPAETVGEVPTVEAEEEPRPSSIGPADEPPEEEAPPEADEPTAEIEPLAAPARITIDAIDVDAEIGPVGLEDDGAMEIPENVQEIGWYEPGVKPGEAGSAVLAGHVDSRSQGRGAFFHLGELDVDDEVVVGDVDGREQRWRVTARTTYPKDELPIDDIFVWGGERQQLVLITCGGDFDDHTRHYSENIVVYTEPIVP